MSEGWLAKRIEAGDQLAERLLRDEGSPIHHAVELGRAAGVLAVKYHERHGTYWAQDYLKALVAVFNLETAKLNETEDALTLFKGREE